MPSREGTYGLLAEFDNPSDLVRAARQAREDGWRRMDCYTPYPVEEAAEAIGFHRNRVPLVTLIGGLMGLAAMFSMETWISVIAYPLNIGGRPLYSWPAFIVPAYEWTILWAGLSAAFGMLALNGLPQLYHPLFNAPNFRDGATTDKFFLCLEASTPNSISSSRSATSKTLTPSQSWRWITNANLHVRYDCHPERSAADQRNSGVGTSSSHVHRLAASSSSPAAVRTCTTSPK